MSIKQMTKVFDDQTVKGNEKLLFLSLADFSNDEGVCHPSYNTLMKKTTMNKASVSKWLKSLEDKNKILKAKRKRKNGANSSNKYLLFPADTFEFLDEEDKLCFVQSLEVELGGDSLKVELAQSLENKLPASLENKLQSEPPVLTTNSFEPSIREIIEHLNHVTGKRFSPKAKEAVSCITARLKEGYVIDDFKHVNIVKHIQWGQDKLMKQYIVPATLYGNKFDKYLNQELSDDEKANAIVRNSDMSYADMMKAKGY